MSVPRLIDYVVFFECEPEWTHPEGWGYGARFTTQRGADRVSATIAPDDTSFSVEWWQDGKQRLRFQSVLVGDWQIESEGPRERLRVRFRNERPGFCQLQLRPHVFVECEMAW